MGRAIVRNPKVFLFDEPLSNLDAKLRVQMRTEIKRVHQKVQDHDRLCDPRPGRGDDARRPRRGDEPGPHRADRHAARPVSPPAHALRGGLHRLTGDEFHPLPSRAGRFGPARAHFGHDCAARAIGPQEARYRSVVSKELVLGLRPEHITEPRHNGRTDGCDFDVTLDVVEPMGMETMVFFAINGTEFCSRVEPSSAGDAGAEMRLHANVDHMHLIDPASRRGHLASLSGFRRGRRPELWAGTLILRRPRHLCTQRLRRVPAPMRIVEKAARH